MGTIANIYFLGAVVRIQVLVGSYNLLIDTFNHPHLELPSIGSTLWYLSQSKLV
jgi:hypothetical protein